MGFDMEKLRPFVLWGIGGGILGTALFLLASAIQDPGWPGNVQWSPGMATMFWSGFLSGIFFGVAIVGFLQLVDRNSPSMVKRRRAEKRDPQVVAKLYSDVLKGDETEAWHAIALLANYKDPGITRNMLKALTERLDDKEIFTLDRLAMVRHAVKNVVGTRSQSNIEQLRPYASDMESDIGVQVRRLNLHRGGRDYSLK